MNPSLPFSSLSGPFQPPVATKIPPSPFHRRSLHQLRTREPVALVAPPADGAAKGRRGGRGRASRRGVERKKRRERREEGLTATCPHFRPDAPPLSTGVWDPTMLPSCLQLKLRAHIWSEQSWILMHSWRISYQTIRLSSVYCLRHHKKSQDSFNVPSTFAFPPAAADYSPPPPPFLAQGRAGGSGYKNDCGI